MLANRAPQNTSATRVMAASSVRCRCPVSTNHFTGSPKAQSSSSGKSPTGLTTIAINPHSTTIAPSTSRSARSIGEGVASSLPFESGTSFGLGDEVSYEVMLMTVQPCDIVNEHCRRSGHRKNNILASVIRSGLPGPGAVLEGAGGRCADGPSLSGPGGTGAPYAGSLDRTRTNGGN